MDEIVIKTKKRITIPKEECPIDYIISLGDLAKSSNFVFEKECVSRIIMGRMTKLIKRKGEKISIQWPDTQETMEFIEISNTHRYLLSEMSMKELSIRCVLGEVDVIIIE